MGLIRARGSSSREGSGSSHTTHQHMKPREVTDQPCSAAQHLNTNTSILASHIHTIKLSKQVPFNPCHSRHIIYCVLLWKWNTLSPSKHTISSKLCLPSSCTNSHTHSLICQHHNIYLILYYKTARTRENKYV